MIDIFGIRRKLRGWKNLAQYKKALTNANLDTVSTEISTDNFSEMTTSGFALECINASQSIPIDRIWRKHEAWGGKYQGAYDYFDTEILCGIIRTKNIKKIIEISPNHGWSTLFMRLAENSLEYHISFDIGDYENLIRQKLREFEVEGDWQFVLGDVKKTVLDYLERLKEADLIFIDSDHRKEFAEWYLHDLKIFDIAKPGCLIHIHDIYPKGSEPPVDCGESPYIIDWAMQDKVRDKFNIMHNYELSHSEKMLSELSVKRFINHGGFQAWNPAIWFEKK